MRELTGGLFMRIIQKRQKQMQTTQGPNHVDVLNNIISKSDMGHVSDTFIDTLRNATPIYQCDGTFTVCVIKIGNHIYSGASKRNPTDKPNSMRGKAVALTRAIRYALDSVNHK